MSRCVKATCPLCDCCTSSPHGGGMPEKPHGSILRRAGPLMLARLGVAAFTFAIPMVLARILLPESYGTFKQAWLLSTTLVLVLPLGLNQSLVYFVPREPARKRLWQSHALVLTTALGAVAAALLLGLGPLVASAFHNRELAAVMPYVAAFTGLRLAASCYDLALMAQGRIRASAAVRLASEGFYTLCLLAGALWTRSVAGAFAGVVIATSAKAGACWIALASGGLQISRQDLRRQLAYALPFGAAFALVIPQQQFHSYLVSASVSAAARRRDARARPEPVHVPGQCAQAGADGAAGLGRADALGAHRRPWRVDLRGGDLPVHPAPARCPPLRDRHPRRPSAGAFAPGRGGGRRRRARRAGAAFRKRAAPGPALQRGNRLRLRVSGRAAGHGSAPAGARLDSAKNAAAHGPGGRLDAHRVRQLRQSERGDPQRRPLAERARTSDRFRRAHRNPRASRPAHASSAPDSARAAVARCQRAAARAAADASPLEHRLRVQPALAPRGRAARRAH